jgi:hypothetical protein
MGTFPARERQGESQGRRGKPLLKHRGRVHGQTHLPRTLDPLRVGRGQKHPRFSGGGNKQVPKVPEQSLHACSFGGGGVRPSLATRVVLKCSANIGWHICSPCLAPKAAAFLFLGIGGRILFCPYFF